MLSKASKIRFCTKTLRGNSDLIRGGWPPGECQGGRVMGMVKAGGFLQQSYVAVGGLRYPCRPATFLPGKVHSRLHLESADIHLNIDGNGQSRRIPPPKYVAGIQLPWVSLRTQGPVCNSVYCLKWSHTFFFCFGPFLHQSFAAGTLLPRIAMTRTRKLFKTTYHL